jgi:hypothetical protein
MFSERTSVGLDVHARTTTAWALDGETGEVFSERLDAKTHNVLAWVATLPQPVSAVTQFRRRSQRGHMTDEEWVLEEPLLPEPQPLTGYDVVNLQRRLPVGATAVQLLTANR